MTHLAICDRHTRYRSGCAGCARRARAYLARRELAVMYTGAGFSRASDLTARRIWELRANGWDLHNLAAKTGLHWHHLSDLCTGRMTYVTLTTYHAVENTYRELRDLPGPSNRARTWALKAGYAPPDPPPMPDDYVDPVVVERITKGERVPAATRAEKRAAYYQLEAWGLDTPTIARRLGVSGDAVSGWRRGHREPFGVKPRRPHKQRTA